MQREFVLNFIKQNDFEEHVLATIKSYNSALQSINLAKFNSNIIDPIKLLFDKAVFNKTYHEIIDLELQRQRDKTNNNSIGYFHQNIFKFIDGCEVPNHGWDIIFHGKNRYYIELKNKHNTMNSSSSAKTFIKMQNHLLANSDNSICALVEVIAKKSSDIPWEITIDGIRQNSLERLRRISIDKFYKIVTSDEFAFKKLCYQLPITIDKLLNENRDKVMQKDSVIDELYKLDSNILNALYKLAFSTYEGF
ncbi:MAG: Eco47II family restriction endonuclease [Campylobacter sp.]|nr:Eco47II family restriction endonuclease [Campylobacter sp.]MBR6612172.1 Eco47II family restriction endonuclease [Campylobacter sp.]